MDDRQERVLRLLDTAGVRLHALLGRLTLDSHATGDLMQELFIRLSKSSKFDRAKNPYAYAWQAAINLAFEWRRKRKFKYQQLEEDCSPPDAEPSVLDRMIRTEELNQILDATAQLSELGGSVLVMRYIEQMSYENIAQRLRKKPQYLRSVSSKALARLQVVLKSHNRHG